MKEHAYRAQRMLRWKMVFCYTVLVSIGLLSSQTVFAGTADEFCEDLFTSARAVPAGWGAAYNVLSVAKETLISSDCKNATSDISVKVSNTSQGTMVYRYGYWWNDGTWQPYNFVDADDNVAPTGGLFIEGNAISEEAFPAPEAGKARYFVAYSCIQQNNVWKCGCKDQACLTSSWQLQGTIKKGTDCFEDCAVGELPRMRGVNVSLNYAKEAVYMNQMQALGIDFVRVHPDKYDTVTLVDDKCEMNEKVLSDFKTTINLARQRKMKVIIDLHGFPGYYSKPDGSDFDGSTLRPDYVFWKEKKYQDCAVFAWAEVAKRFAGEDATLVGYDLYNEPHSPKIDAASGLECYFCLVDRTIAAIREHDPKRILIVYALGGRLQGRGFLFADTFEFIRKINDPHIAYQLHIWSPKEFNLGVETPPYDNERYPGTIAGVYWDKAKIRSILDRARQFQLEHDVPIFMGEIGPSIRSHQASAEAFLMDAGDIMEEYGWTWSFHSFGGGPRFDITRDPGLLEVMEDYWAINS